MEFFKCLHRPNGGGLRGGGEGGGDGEDLRVSIYIYIGRLDIEIIIRW